MLWGTPFGILLDDIPNTLNTRKIKRFPSIAEAHAYFVNRLVDYLQDFDASIKLALCPLQYYGSGEEEYIRAFSALLQRMSCYFGPEKTSVHKS